MLSTEATNIINVYKRATACDLQSGLDWYTNAQDLANALAAGTPFSSDETAGVIAALSPRMAWPTNVKAATTMVRYAALGLDEPTVAGFAANRAKAWEILTGTRHPTAILGGPKVRSFYANIMGDENAVTIDVWAAKAAGLDGPASFTPRQYERIADVYREAAELLSIPPRTLQAAVWTTIRRETLATMPRHAYLLDRKDF